MTVVVQSSASLSTLAWLLDRIQARGYGADSRPAQVHALNAALRRICGMRRWPFLELTAVTFNTVAGTPSYAFSAIAADFLHPDAVGLKDGTQNLELDYEHPAALRRRERIYGESGTPYMWTARGHAIRFYPTPDKVMTAVADYVKAPTPFQDDDDVSPIPPTYEDVLVWHAIADLAVRQRDLDTHQVAKQQGNEVLRAMMDEYGVRQRQNATEVVRTGEVEQVNRHTPSSWPVY